MKKIFVLVLCAAGACAPDVEVARFHGESFLAVWGASPDDVWAAAVPYDPDDRGARPAIRPCGPDVFRTETIVRRWDGRRWSRVMTPFDRPVLAIAGSGADDVWVGGMDGLVARWDGQGFSRLDVSAVATHDGLTDLCHDQVNIVGLWSPGRGQIWAVGHILPSRTGPALVLQYDGTSWTRHRLEAPDGLSAVWGSGPRDVWVGGNSGLLFHHDGGGWTRVDAGTDRYRNGLWGSGPRDVWAVGNGGAITHFDGTTWSLRATGGDRWYDAVSGRDAGEVWAVGHELPAGGAAVVSRWDGAAWSDAATGLGEPLADVWASQAGGAWAVGEGLIVRLR
jgi:hypothetical protein